MRLSDRESTRHWITRRLNAVPGQEESIDTLRARSLALFGAAAGAIASIWLAIQLLLSVHSVATALTAAGAIALAATFLFLRLFKTPFWGGVWFATWLLLVLATQTFTFGPSAPYLYCLLVPVPVIFALTSGATVSVYATLVVCVCFLVSGVQPILTRQDPHPDFFALLLTAVICAQTSGMFVAYFTRYREQEKDQLVQVQKELKYSASVDPLTGVLNRRAFDQAILDLKAGRESGLRPALILFDLDKFKLVNDTFGHAAGDQVLREIATRVRQQMSDGESFFRLGGDEFAIILRHAPHAEGLFRFAQTLIAQTSRPVSLANSSIRMDLSLGIAMSEADGSGIGSLYGHADTASFFAKEQAGSRAVLFEKHLNSKVVRRNAVEAQLSQALLQNRFEIAFQPQMNIATGRVIGFESLARWTDPKLGVVTPDEFVRVAEESALIDRFDRFIVEHSLRLACQWLGPERHLSVNVSARSIVSADFCRFVMGQIRQFGFKPRQIELEITETALIENWAACRKNLSALRRLGVRIVLDDFGIGYSSLSYLSQFPVQKLKFDKSFLSQTNSPATILVMQAIIQLAEALDMEIVAEGVDCNAHVELLSGLGCLAAQGFLYSKPIMHFDMPAYIARIDPPEPRALVPLRA